MCLYQHNKDIILCSSGKKKGKFMENHNSEQDNYIKDSPDDPSPALCTASLLTGLSSALLLS